MTCYVPIAEVAKLNPSPPSELFDDPKREVSFVPMAQLGEDGRLHNGEVRSVGELTQGYTYFANGDVIVAKITPCLQNGKAALAEELKGGHAFGSTEFHVLRPGPAIDGRYLFYMVWNPAFRHFGETRFTGSAGQKRMPPSAVAEFQIPLPFPDDPERSLSEQKRIAAILEKADAIRRRRRQDVLTELSELPRSVFLELLGDPATNPKHWSVRPLGDSFSNQRPGAKCGPFGTALAKSEYVQSGVPVYGIDNVLPNRFREEGSLFITTAKFGELQSYAVLPGDVLISRAGTVGRMCVARPTRQPAIIGTNLIRVVLDPNKMVPEYMTALFTYFSERLPGLRSSSDDNAYSFMKTSVLERVPVPSPDEKYQRKYATFMRCFEKEFEAVEDRQRRADDLFSSLVQRAFRGEL